MRPCLLAICRAFLASSREICSAAFRSVSSFEKSSSARHVLNGLLQFL